MDVDGMGWDATGGGCCYLLLGHKESAVAVAQMQRKTQLKNALQS